MEKMASLFSLTKEVISFLFVILNIYSEADLLVGSMEATSDGMLASPGVAEKGYFDLRMTVSTSGGHSSVPPQHTVSDHDDISVSHLWLIFILHLEHRYSCGFDCTTGGEPIHTPSIQRTTLLHNSSMSSPD